ncbi:TetR/AcrR family transcriptional regulator [Gordonia sp. TBRC 11910]|uniref:TetR/AcrR family transcriptional regulator n=1 Tax=Gordonia asplenii TaxID=2725283 RepID=A0A848KZF7_9ACTN|nr:TetR/AcrR family transcriptional regulator [Gordonia asplenii]NMO01571.1 TetR/AcrR family transcriptional regulator [Gordonia asplenii]
MTPDDRTTRARVRDTAIQVFARDGFSATVRAIAAAAEVSPGLVIHHFGSKAGLEAECDQYVLDTLFDVERDLLTGDGGYREFLDLIRHAEDSGEHVVYMLRAVQQGGATARAFLDRMLAQATEGLRIGVESGQLRPSVDEEGRARYLTTISVGALLLDTVMNPPDDWSDFGSILRGYIDRVGIAGTEMAVHGVMTDASLLDAIVEAQRESAHTRRDTSDQSGDRRVGDEGVDDDQSH